jgi:hypothetical protein
MEARRPTRPSSQADGFRTLRKHPKSLDTNRGRDVPRFLVFSRGCGLFANSPANPSRLPDELDGKLDLPGSCLRGRNETSAGNKEPALIENGQILSGRGKVGAIKDIEKFGAELSIEALRNSFHGVVLENREIQVRYAWTNQAVAAQISPAVETREGEALSLDIGIGISGID